MASVWFLDYRNPDRDRADAARRRSIAHEGDPPGERTRVTLREWKLLFRFRTTWGMILGYFGCIYLTWIYTAWLPGYLEIERHMSVKFTGVAAAIPFAWGVVGGVSGGYFADILVRRGVSPVQQPAISGRDRARRHGDLHGGGGVCRPRTRWPSPSSRPRCSSSMSPAPAPGR